MTTIRLKRQEEAEGRLQEIFAAIMSAYLLKERFRARRYASVSLVALGAVLLH